MRKPFGSVSDALTFGEELESRKLFGSVRKAPTFEEEPMLSEVLWISFGLLVPEAFNIFP